MTNKSISATPSEKKVRRALKNVEKDKAYAFAAIVERAYKTDPDPKDIEELRSWLDQYPDLWMLVFDVAQVIESNLIKRMIPNEAAHSALEKNAENLRQSLGYEDAPAMERALIDNIIVSWLRCQWAEYRLLAYMGQDESFSSIIAFWEKRLSVAQNRYLKACETLAKIRRLAQKHPLLQLNIATESGQQVNVAGDVVKQ